MSDKPLPQSEIILYQTNDGRTRIQCRFEGETIWLLQALIAALFQVTAPTVNGHLKGIFADGELEAGPGRHYPDVRERRAGASEVSRRLESDQAVSARHAPAHYLRLTASTSQAPGAAGRLI